MKHRSGSSSYVVARSLLPSFENASPPTPCSTGIHRSTSPVARSSRPIRWAGRFRSSTAAVFRPGATATKDQRESSSYVPVFGSSSE
nr:hypothetical protein [Streptomyces regalis]